MEAAEVAHISEKPWSDYTEADYTIDQWHRACLIHQHSGPPTSKSQCKLPVKTPNGALNRNGVHAAAAALSGARSPIKATPEEKAKAASALRGYYNQLGETPPDSLKQSAMAIVDNILEHHGIKGMKWGVRRKATVGGGVQMHPDAARARTTHETLKRHGTHVVSTSDLQHYANRLSTEQNVSRLQSNQKNAGAKFVAKTLGRVGNRVVDKVIDKAFDASLKVVLSK
jgi:hypothetical protein